MELISLPRLRLKQLQTLGESTLEICRPLNEVAPAVDTLSTVLDAFKKAMLKDSVSASQKHTLDKKRDRLIYGLMHQIKAEQYFTHTRADVVETVKKLAYLAQKYGTKLSRLPLNEESAGIDNMLAELEQLNPEALQLMGIARWIPLISDANEEFKAAALEYTVNSAEAAETETASNLAPKLIDALEGLYTLLFAQIKITKSEKLEMAYAQINEWVKSLR